MRQLFLAFRNLDRTDVSLAMAICPDVAKKSTSSGNINGVSVVRPVDRIPRTRPRLQVDARRALSCLHRFASSVVTDAKLVTCPLSTDPVSSVSGHLIRWQVVNPM